MELHDLVTHMSELENNKHFVFEDGVGQLEIRGHIDFKVLKVVVY